MAKIKPFSKPGYTMFHNYILDHIMPDLSSSAWKVLCVAIRQTIGWVDEHTESGRREEDRISYSQFLEKTGLGSKTTVSKGIKECMDKQYLLRDPSVDHAQGYDYRLNTDYEIELETGTETGQVMVKSMETGTETGQVFQTGTETGQVSPKTGTVSGHTKEIERKEEEERKKEIQSHFYITGKGVKVYY